MNSPPPSSPSPHSDHATSAQRFPTEIEQLFREITETVADIFCVADAQQRKVLYVNPAYERISGRSREQFLRNYKDWMEGVHPDDRQRVAESFHVKTMEGKFDEEFRIIRPDGTIVWIRGCCYPVLSDQGVAHVIGVAQDITDRKLAEELAQNHSRAMEEQAQLLDLANDAIIARDSESRVTFWNKGAESLYGWTVEDAEGRTLHALLSTPPESVDEFRAALLERGEWLGELRHKTRDGKEIIVLSRHVLQRSAGGEVVRILEINRDITESKQAQMELLETKQHLEQLVAQRTAALQELSGRLLRMQDEERRRIARELHDSMGQELSVTKMLLESAVQRGLANPENEHGVIQSLEMVENVLKEVRSLSYLLHPPLLDEMGLAPALHWYVEGLSQRSGLKVALTIEPSEFGRFAPELETAVFRIVQECLTNVYKHAQSTTADVRVEQSQSHVRIMVEDGGIGISEDKLGKLSTTIGVGIGGMRERVRQFGGEVQIFSTSEGTTVEVILPLRRNPGSDQASPLRSTA